MNDDSDSIFSFEVLRKRFPDLSDAEIGELRRELAHEPPPRPRDVVRDEEVDRLLRREVPGPEGPVPAPPEGPVPALPVKVRAAMERARLEMENENGGADLYALPKRYVAASRDLDAPVSHWHTASVVAGGLAVAAAIVVAYVSFVRPVTSMPTVDFADAVTLLTPGAETSFLQPVFTWNTDNSGVVDVRIISPDGTVLAVLDRVFSPLRWGTMEIATAMEQGGEYRLEISSPEGTLATRSFRISETAQGSPEPAGSLDGILRQCQGFLSENRPADAWMLWAELTAGQKADPRMQELKEQILAVLAG